MRAQLTNDQLAAFHYIRPDALGPAPDTIVVTEREHLFKSFVNRYKDSSTVLKEKLLKEVLYYFQDAMTMIYALENSEILTLLLNESLSTDSNLALLAIQSCEYICRERRGRVCFMNSKGTSVLKGLFYKGHNDIRKYVYLCVEKLVEDSSIIPSLLDDDFFTLVWQRLKQELQVDHLYTLNKILGLFLLMDSITVQALDNNVEDIIKEQCNVPDTRVIASAVNNLLYITYHTQGKLRIVNKKIHISIVERYFSSEPDHVTFMAFFGSVAQITEAKKDFIGLGLVDEALRFVRDDATSELVLNCLLLLTSLAEYGNQRLQLKSQLKTIEKLYERDDSDLLREYIDDLIQAINWTP